MGAAASGRGRICASDRCVGALPFGACDLNQARELRKAQPMTQFQFGGRFIRAGFWVLFLGFVMSFGMVLHYVVGARYDTGSEFLKNVTLWFACPWTLSTAVVLGGALGMIAIGAVYAILGEMSPPARVEGLEHLAGSICALALAAIFLTGYVGYFVVDHVWPGFFYV